MSNFEKPISDFFHHNVKDSPNQSTLRNQYQSLFWTIDAISTTANAEKSVAKRKLLESLDAALRAAE